MRLLLCALLLLALAGCTKTNAPLKMYFIGSARFTAGNRTAAPADTLAARLYLADTLSDPKGLKNLRVTVDYSRRAPFAYPTPISAFLLSSVQPSTEQLVYLDTTFVATNAPTEYLYTATFGVRTTTGTERWTFTATDQAGNSAARSFVISQRRSDSLAVFNDYTLKLQPATGPAGRRYIDLKSGLVLPGYTVATQPEQQQQIDAILLPASLQLASPSALSDDYFKSNTWAKDRRSTTLFSLTTLTSTGFTNATDALTISQQFVAPGTGVISGLSPDQVYAFRTGTTAGQYVYGLLRVLNTAVGLQLQVRTAKPPL